MNMQNRHDANVHALNPIHNGICQAKLTEVHPSNIIWHLLLAEIFNSPISAGTYHGQRVATLVWCGANQLEPQIGLRGCYVTLYKTVYPSPPKSLLWCHQTGARHYGSGSSGGGASLGGGSGQTAMTAAVASRRSTVGVGATNRTAPS